MLRFDCSIHSQPAAIAPFSSHAANAAVQSPRCNPIFLRVLRASRLRRFRVFVIQTPRVCAIQTSLTYTGNLAASDREALFLMDYPRRERLKILGHVRIEDARQHPDAVARLAEPEVSTLVERIFLIDVVSFDWNCPKYITPRYTEEEVREAVAPLKARIAELERELGLRTGGKQGEAV